MQHRATLHAMTPQRLQDCWEDEQTSEAGRTPLRKKTRPWRRHMPWARPPSFLVQSLLLGPQHGRQAMGCSWRAMREEGRLTW